ALPVLLPGISGSRASRTTPPSEPAGASPGAARRRTTVARGGRPGSSRRRTTSPRGAGEQETSPAISPRIHLNRAEPQRCEALAEGGHPLLEHHHEGGIDLDARRVSRVAHPQIAPDALRTEIRLRLLDLLQTGRRDRQTVLNAARETGRRGRVPVRQAERF